MKGFALGRFINTCNQIQGRNMLFKVFLMKPFRPFFKTRPLDFV